jgi:hypothetical protein
MALEDAVCLDAVLRKEQNLAGAFARLETLRARRTAQAQLTSRRMGEEVYHPAGGKPWRATRCCPGCPSGTCSKVDWLYAHEAVPVT